MMSRPRFNLLAATLLGGALLAASAVNAEAVTPGSSDGVSATIPWHELKGLLEASWAAEHALPADSGPRYAFGPAKVTGVLGGGRLVATIELPIRSFSDAPTLVKLFDSAPALANATLGKNPAPLVVGNDATPGLPYGALGVVVMGRGEHALRLEVVAPAPEVPGPNSTSLPALPSAAVTVDLKVSEELSGVTVGGVAIEETDDHHFRLALGGGMSLVVQYVAAAPPEEKGAPEEVAVPRVTATVKSLLEVGDGVLRLGAIIDLAISRAPITEARIALPEGWELVRCEAAGVRRCAADDPKVLHVEMAYEVDRALSLSVVLERGASGEGTSEERWPTLRVLDAEHEVGFLGVVAESGIEVGAAGSDGVLPLDVVELPPDLQAMSARPALLAFRYTRHPFKLTLAVTRHPSGEVLSSAVDRATITLVSTEDGDRVGRALYRVRNNRKQFLVVTLPLDAAIWNAFVAGEPVKPGESDPAPDGRPVFLVPLARSAGGAGGVAEAFDVEVIYFRRGRALSVAGTVAEDLPSVDLPVSEMNVFLFLPDGHDYLSAGGDLDTDFGIDTTSWLDIPARNSGFMMTLSREDGDDGVAAYDYDDGEAEEALDDDDDWDGPAGGLKLDAAKGRKELASLSMRTKSSGGLTRGVLPVKFTLPERGVLVPFSTALVLPGESPSIYVRYGPPWIGAAATVLGAGAFMAALLVLLGAMIRARRRRRLSGADVQLWLGTATGIVATAVVLFAGGSLELAVFGGVALVVGYGVLRWLIERKGKDPLAKAAELTAAFAAAGADGSAPASSTATPTVPVTDPPAETAPATEPSEQSAPEGNEEH